MVTIELYWFIIHCCSWQGLSRHESFEGKPVNNCQWWIWCWEDRVNQVYSEVFDGVLGHTCWTNWAANCRM